MNIISPRKLKRLRLSRHLLQAMLSGTMVASNVPGDVIITNIAYDIACDSVTLLLFSDQFDPLGDGAGIPLLDPDWKELGVTLVVNGRVAYTTDKA